MRQLQTKIGRTLALGLIAGALTVSFTLHPAIAGGKCPEHANSYALQAGDNCLIIAARKPKFHFNSPKDIVTYNKPFTGFKCPGAPGQLICYPKQAPADAALSAPSVHPLLHRAAQASRASLVIVA